MTTTMRTIRLYEATDQLDVVRGWIEENSERIIEAGGELPSELATLLDEAEGAFAEKAERVALYVRELLATAAAVDEEAKRLAARAAVQRRAAEGLKDYLRAQLERAGVPKVEGALVTLRLQKSPPSVACALDQEALRALFVADGGAAFVDVVPESYRLASRRVLDAYKAGSPLPDGITVSQSSHVRIA